MLEEIGGLLVLERAQGVGVDMSGDLRISASVVVGIKRDVTEIELEMLFVGDQVASQI